MNHRTHIAVFCCMVLLVAAGAASAQVTAVTGTVFHPYDPPALGKLHLTSGNLTFDTTDLTVSGSVSGAERHEWGCRCLGEHEC